MAIPQVTGATQGASATSQTITCAAGYTVIAASCPVAESLPTTTGQTPKMINASDSGWKKILEASAGNQKRYLFGKVTTANEQVQTGAPGTFSTFAKITATTYDRFCPYELIYSNTAGNWGSGASGIFTVPGAASTHGADRLVLGFVSADVDSGNSLPGTGTWSNGTGFSGPALAAFGAIQTALGSGGGWHCFYGGRAAAGAVGDTTIDSSRAVYENKNYLRWAIAIRPAVTDAERSVSLDAVSGVAVNGEVVTGILNRAFRADASDKMTLAQGAIVGTGALSIFALFRDPHLTGPAGKPIISEAGFHLTFDAGNLAVYKGITALGVCGVITPHKWYIVGMTRPAGANQLSRGHVCDLETGTWTHSDLVSSVASDGTGSTVKIADWLGLDSPGNLDIAVAAVWDQELSDATIETLDDGSDSQVWFYLTPKALWDFNQAATSDPVEDIMGGGADEASITGTTVIDTGPRDWRYYGAAATVEASLSIAAQTAVTITRQIEAERSAAISAATGVEVSGDRIVDRSLIASAAIDVEIGRQVVAERSAAFSADADVQVGFIRILDRSIVVSAATAIEIARQIEAERSAQVSASADVILGAGERVLDRSVSASASADVQIANFQRVLDRSLSLIAATDVTISYLRELNRSLSFIATTGIDVNGRAGVVIEASLSFAALALISISGQAHALRWEMASEGSWTSEDDSRWPASSDQPWTDTIEAERWPLLPEE